MKKLQMYEANDGTRFPTAIGAKNHEIATYWKKLANLTEADIGRAIRREDIPLGDAFERVGNMIAEKRRENGELLRRRGQQKTSSSQLGALVTDAQKAAAK